MSLSYRRMFPLRQEGLRAYGEAVQEHIYGRRQERRQIRLHLAELQRREQARIPPNQEDSEMEDRESIIGSDRSAEGDRDDLNSDINSEGFASDSSGSSSKTYLALEDRTLFYAMFVLLFGLSREQISWMELLMTVLYGKPPPITYERNVAVLNRRITEEYDHQKYFFCTECSASMNEKEFACRNRSCTNFGIAVKRAKRLQRTEVHVINIIPQLTDVLVRGLEKIITMHQMLHDNRGVPTEDRSDIRLFEGYYHSIESPAEFAQQRLRILLTISLDGFVPRRVSKFAYLQTSIDSFNILRLRREMWPLYLRVEGLPPLEANKYFNSIIAGAIYSRLKPSEKMIEVLFGRLDSELRSIHEVPLEIVIGEVTWTIEVQLYRGVSDMPAQQLLYGVPRWNAEYGCSKCYIQGLRMGNQRVWVPSDDENPLLRSDESYAVDAETQQEDIHDGRHAPFAFPWRYPSHLKNLPEAVEDFLQDMGEDMLGYGQDDLKNWLDLDLSSSTFYKNLGTSEEERRATLEELRIERAQWRPKLFRALQFALRDVRSYNYENGKWIPNARRAKRGTDATSEGVPECSRYGAQPLEEPDENLPPQSSPHSSPPNSPPPQPNPPLRRRRR